MRASTLSPNLVNESDRRPASLLSVSIYGAGPTGAMLAYGLAQLGCSVSVQDPAAPETLSSRSRAYAITHSSRRLLERLGLWADLASELIPFDQLMLQDQWVRPQVRFGISDLRPGNQSCDAIGWILDHRPLMELLLERLQRQPNVTLCLGAQHNLNTSESESDADLVVAADGPRSIHRQKWGLPLWSMLYRQGCLTTKVALRGVEASTAHEYFRAEGPFAVLPLGDQAFQVVWSAPLEICRRRAELPPADLLDLLTTVLPTGLVPDALLDKPQAVPLQLTLAPRLGRGHRVLVGESGHRCHPVGGQGLNLCWRDVSDLLDLVGESRLRGNSVRRLVRRYQRRRLPDLILVAVSTDLLLRVFSNSLPLLLPLRRLGLWLLRRSPGLRRLALQSMSDGPMTFFQSPPDWRD